jgi:hypothetical protein
MEKLAKYLTPDESAAFLKNLIEELGCQEVAVVRNLDYVFSPFEFYPMAPKVTQDLDEIVAFAVDMDGTSTTTEPLALHSLEYMVRRFTGRMTKTDWDGLDPILDYPHVIGNSNFRHTEFLVKRYGLLIDHDAFRSAFFESLLWTLCNMDDKQRVKDISQNAVNCGLGCVLEDPEFKSLLSTKNVNEDNVASLVKPFIKKYGKKFDYDNPSAMVSAALDIYYTRYHSILQQIENGDSERLSIELLGEGNRRLIEPMPGYAVFIALIRGWLGESAGLLLSELEHPEDTECAKRLSNLGKYFENKPAKIALVTASIAYEAHTVVREVFNVMREQVTRWPISTDMKRELKEKFGDYTAVYDGFVTASDSSELRLKPHRDLFSIGLYQMSIPKDDYCRCIGLEDTEPGVIALRAAGVGCAVALPNHDTSRQNYEAASHIVKGGLSELIVHHNLYLRHE